ncbi:MAG: ATP-binding cassette domain-containing protein [Betaproteobacteria bacterium]|nr:ATP-binding cassette domain-containing protein [Betaproteobacteria bacterium]
MRLDVDLTLTLESRKRRFDLNVAFSSDEDRIVVFGQSGAGKSATLQAIAGLLRPRQGRIVVGERTLFDSSRHIDLPARERRVGYVFQDYALFPHLTLWDNVAYGLKHIGKWRLSEIERAQVVDMLKLMGLHHLAEARPETLSGGQRQRVALARALVTQPQLLLMDEPFAALDFRLRQRMREELAEIQQRFAVPLILITHDLQDVEHLGQTVVVIDLGQVTRTIPLQSLRQSCGADTLMAELAQLCGGA